jgi:hypothetical protein
MGPNGSLSVDCVVKDEHRKGIYVAVVTTIGIDNGRGKVAIGDPDAPAQYQLHPATTKRWLELLLAHPRIGPELRARMNS